MNLLPTSYVPASIMKGDIDEPMHFCMCKERLIRQKSFLKNRPIKINALREERKHET